MRTYSQFVAVLALAAGTSLAADQASAQERLRYTLNDGWRFTMAPVEFGEKALISTAGWQEVSLPHTWNATDWRDDEPSYRRAIGWYRRVFDVPEARRGQRLYLQFEGVNQVADVYVNGAFAGRHEGGYTAFTLDITRLVQFGRADNLLAVQVNNAHDPGIPPLSVGFALYGGIYRDVWLISTAPVHFDMADHGAAGVYVTTPRVTRERAEARVRGRVSNDGAGPKRVRAVSTLRDAAGVAVGSAATEVTVSAGANATFEHALPAVVQPRLWAPATPYLYTVETSLVEGDVVLDRVRSPLGFRWFRFDPDSGFFLNGARLQLQGTNRHQDYEGLGSALNNALHVRDLEWIKAMGANFLRLAHYPQDPAVLDAADRLGLLIWEEVPVVNYITVSERFSANAERMLREMIRQHHDHPSVTLWGTMNEVFLWSPEGARIGRQTDTTYLRQVRQFAARMDAAARAEDPSRYTAMAIHGSADYDDAGISDIPQVLGLNLYSGWYGGTFPEFGATLDRRHAEHPNQVLFVSEYGSGSDLTLNSLYPERFDHSSAWHRLYHESHLRQTTKRPYLSGTAIWNQFDFSQPHIGETMPNMNQKGMQTFDRRPKDVYYLYRANWTTEPLVYIASRDWTHRTGTDTLAPRGAGVRPVSQPVQVYSNAATVELFHNGRSLGARTPDDVRSASWDVPFTDGSNVLEARAQARSSIVTDRLEIRFDYYPPVLADASVPFRGLAVNVGARAQFADAEGAAWEADQPYRPGAFGYTGGASALIDRSVPITGTRQPGLVASYRGGIESYRFDVPAGDYQVELRFAEPAALAAGERVFDVLINGRVVIPALDMAGRNGRAREAAITVHASADTAGLMVSFRPLAGEPILNGIRVIK